MAKPWYSEGLTFKCEGTSCGDCCSGKWGSGYVFVDRSEMEALAQHLGLSFEKFTRTFVRQVGERYSLIEKKNLDCVFYDKEKGCTVYEGRPKQCRTYPFWPRVVKTRAAWEEEAKSCPGINCGEKCDLHTRERIEELKKASGKD